MNRKILFYEKVVWNMAKTLIGTVTTDENGRAVLNYTGEGF